MIGILLVLVISLFLASSVYAQIDVQASQVVPDKTTTAVGTSIRFIVSTVDVQGTPLAGIFIRPESSIGTFSPMQGQTGNMGTMEFLMTSSVAGTTTVVFYYSYGGAEFVLDSVAVNFVGVSIQPSAQTCQTRYGISNSDPCCVSGTTLLQSRCCANTGFLGNNHILSESCSGTTQTQEVCNLNDDGSVSINSVINQNACPIIGPSTIPPPTPVPNSCPSMTSVTINPVMDDGIYTNTILKASAQGFFDADNDQAQYEYKWYNGNDLIFEEINGAFSDYRYYSRVGDMITVDVRPYDGNCLGTKVSNRVTVQNANPILTIVSDSTTTNPKRSGEMVTFTITSLDREGDNFDYIVAFGDGEQGTVSTISTLQIPSTPACNDFQDNDGNGLEDYPYDPGCSSLQDTTESTTLPLPICSDHIDNDADFFIDWPYDKGCDSASDNTELDPVTSPRCSDGTDNDGDQKTDFPDDAGCISNSDNDEQDPLFFTPDCSNGLDDDGDGFVDLRFDRECFAAVDNEEDAVRSECHDFIDNDADGQRDLADSGCVNPYDMTESGSTGTGSGGGGGSFGNLSIRPASGGGSGGRIGTNVSISSRIVGCTPQTKLGDANGNGQIDVIDLLIINEYSAGLVSYVGDTCCLDANNDGDDGSILDAYYVANIAAGLRPQLGTCANPISGTIPPVIPPQRVRDCLNLNICGDADHDGDVDVLDSLFIARFIVGSESWSQNSWCLDANSNGIVDINDALYTSQIRAGLRQITTSCLLSGMGGGSGSGTTYTPITSASINPYYISASKTFTITHSYITSMNTTFLAIVSAYSSGTIVANASTLVPIVGTTTQSITCPEVLELNAELTGGLNNQVLLTWQLPANAQLIRGLKVCTINSVDENTDFSSDSPQFEANCNLNSAPLLSKTATSYIDTTQNVAQKYYKIQSICTPPPVEELGCNMNSLIGDANQDGDVDGNDAIRLARIAVGIETFNGNICCLDVNDNGRVDIVDGEITQQISEGLIQTFGTCNNRVQPPQNTISDCSVNNILGDVNDDGSVGILDALFIAKYTVGLEQWGSNACCLDANNDDTEGNILDALYAAQVGVGLVRTLGTCENPIEPRMGMPPECEIDSKLGDVNDDDRVNILDALLMSPITTGTSMWGGNDCCLDANNDGVRGNINDVSYITQIASGTVQQLGTCSSPINPIPPTTQPSNCNSNSLLGDTNGDDSVTVLDSLFISQYVAGLKTWGENKCCLDANGFGNKGDILDARYAQEVAVGLKPQLGRCDSDSYVSGIGMITGTAIADISGMQVISASDGTTASSTSSSSTTLSTFTNQLGSTLTTITVGQIAIPIYASEQVYNEIALPLQPKDASVEEAFKSIGLGRGKNNVDSIVAIYTFCNKNNFVGSYDEVRDFSYEDFKTELDNSSSVRIAEIEGSKLYDPVVDCKLYSYGDIDLFNVEPGHNYMLKVTSDNTLRNVGRVVYPRKVINMFESKSNNKNNWFGSTYVYSYNVDNALISDDEITNPFASSYDRIQHFDTLEFKRLISSGASITQAIADSNYDYSPGGVPGMFRLTNINPGEGYRIQMTSDDNLLFAYD